MKNIIDKSKLFLQKAKAYICNINFKSKKSIVSLFLLVLIILGIVFVKTYAYYFVQTSNYTVYSGGVLAQQDEASINIYVQSITYANRTSYNLSDYYVLSNKIPNNGYIVNHTKSFCLGGVNINNLDAINSIDTVEYFDVSVTGKGYCDVYLDVDEDNLPVFFEVQIGYLNVNYKSELNNLYGDSIVNNIIYNEPDIKINDYDIFSSWLIKCTGSDGEYYNFDESYYDSKTYNINTTTVEIHNNKIEINDDFNGGKCYISIEDAYTSLETMIYSWFGVDGTNDCYERDNNRTNNYGKLICDEGKRIVGSGEYESSSSGINNYVSLVYPTESDDMQKQEKFRIIGLVDVDYDANEDGVIDSHDQLIKLVQSDVDLRDPESFRLSNNNDNLDSLTNSPFYNEVYNNAAYPLREFDKMLANARWQYSYIESEDATTQQIIDIEKNPIGPNVISQEISKIGLPNLTDLILASDANSTILHSTSTYTLDNFRGGIFGNVNYPPSWFDNNFYAVEKGDYDSAPVRTYMTINQMLGNKIIYSFSDNTIYNDLDFQWYHDFFWLDTGYSIYLKPGTFVFAGSGTYDDPWLIAY